MEIAVADQRILLFPNQITLEDAKAKAWEKKASAFGAINQMTSFLSRPKDDDFELIYSEHRYQPFWHVAARARYVYDRSAQYQVPAHSKEVTSVTYESSDFEITSGHFHMPVTEHCMQEESDEVFVEGVSGKANPKLKEYLSLSPTLVKGSLEKTVDKKSIIVPPQSRVSAIMRDSLSKMIKGIQADKILEEHVEVTCVDLYYHPVYAFQYRWKSKAKDAIVEVDGLTGAVTTGSRVFSEYMGKVLDINFLFDVGADAAGMLIPGGSIAVKVAKKYIDTKRRI
ncbi:hypothetical protein A3A63_00010 [Candidatus Gottesmanbacteria bacterium RIFCSPLOWO2_01_FULL_46_9]|uniref:Uncharacterized protein n=1 Tax=Candidatus Gottesmanbacteria bacterium RIFCSPLOWO2_01_FULL_46_9 TaxID=1798394 RepID=A0A1F6B2H7_9BACT|nr:MAG: hypothetical protein A3A63_00010 [Candidatus Gottesmanbacteria bacterium RIFCSPLOWO2_01_FULL_46_9]